MPEIEEQDQEQQGNRPFWSGTISFGLVSIPVNLYPANRQSRVPLRMLSPDGKPLQRRYYDPETGKELSGEQTVRGYEYEKGKYVVITDEELERLAPEKSRDIDLRRFVNKDEIPPLYFEKAYFLAPAGGSVKAYRLLAETMEKTNRAGIATFVMRGKEYLVAILAENGILRAETLRFKDEVRSALDVGIEHSKAELKAVHKFSSAIKKLTKDSLSLKEMEDNTSERLLQMAEKKKAAKKSAVVKGEKRKPQAEVIDILAALKKSLSQAKG